MYLKRIETIGFKSFADKTVVEFEPGVTAVVGPNGSGKSNISDAVRWVLGEQSAKTLRGGKMEDIIFAGTDHRKALNYAEVTLVLDNSCQSLPLDFLEVGVTRRVYRSGESEYLINRQKVRLKDVVDLIMDTGIGHDSLSMISQDRVKAIVESRVDERRVIIEEAAGVLKYKMRKKEAGRKLSSTMENLSRVHDIIYELETQVEPLRKQAEVAARYHELNEQMRASDLSLLGYEVTSLSQETQKAKKANQEAQIQLLALTGKAAKDEEGAAQLKSRLSQGESQLDCLQEELVAVSELIQKLSGQRDVLLERQKNASTTKDELYRQKKQLELGLANAQERFRQSASQAKEAASGVDGVKNSLAQTESDYEFLEENLKKQLESSKMEYSENENRLVQVKNLYQTLLRQVEKAESTLGQQEAKLEKAREDAAGLAALAEVFYEKYDRAEENLAEKRKIYKQQMSQAQKTGQSFSKAAQEQQELLHRLDKAKGRLHWLEEAQKDFTGFNDGVKKILQARRENKLPRIMGAVAELVTIPKELEAAMDVVLGPLMQQIVVADDQAARSAIKYLKENRSGRATFLPLNVIKPRSLPDSAARLLFGRDGVVGIASKLIGYQEAYQTIFENLLGSIIVVKDLKCANQLAKELNFRYRIVTLEGDVVNTGGSMTGGAIKRQGSSLLRQKQVIEETVKQIRALEEEVENAKLAAEDLKAKWGRETDEAEKTRAAGERMRDRLNALSNEKVAFDYKRLSASERVENLTSQKEGWAKEALALSAQVNTLAEERVVLEESLFKNKPLILEMEVQLSQQETLKSQLLQKMTEQKIELARFETLLESKEGDQGRVYEDLKEARRLLEQMQVRIDESDSTFLGNDGEVGRLESQTRTHRVRREEVIEEIQKLRTLQSKMITSLESLERELRESRRLSHSLTHTVNINEVALGKMDVELDVLLKRIEVDYQLTYDFVITHHPLKGAVATIRNKITDFKQKINALGTVNTGAIEEYERVNQRFEFLTGQRDDLLAAKTHLEDTIGEMDQEMAVKFKDTFEAVRLHYIETFKKLFGGGNADLVLTDPNDILGTGVEIIAQPPGTKLKTSNLLSGGQKALTSIALLFGILKVRTVPFCILDEVEAALDEANVSRYASYLKTFSEETQFIVITHRKGTMEKADVLYGVTMQERGVTKLVSVRMENIGGYLDAETA